MPQITLFIHAKFLKRLSILGSQNLGLKKNITRMIARMRKEEARERRKTRKVPRAEVIRRRDPVMRVTMMTLWPLTTPSGSTRVRG